MSSIKIQEKRPAARPEPPQETGIGATLWRVFCSTKTAIGLVLLLAAASIAGTLTGHGIPDSIRGSWWYSTFLLVVGLDLAICTISRLNKTRRLMARPVVATTPRDVARLLRSETMESAGGPEAVAEKVVRALRSRKYHVLTQSSGQLVSLYATRGRAGVWGAYLTNISLLVIFAGVLTGQPTGPDGTLTLIEGKRAADYHRTKPHQHFDLPFQVGLSDFRIQHDESRQPVGYQSDVQIFEDGRTVTHKVVDVDHPLTYRGLSFSQADYGLVGLVLKVTAPGGESAFLGWDIKTENTANGRVYSLADKPLHQFPLSGKNVTLYVHNLVPDYADGSKGNASALPLNPAVKVLFSDDYTAGKGPEAWKPLGWMTVGKTASHKGYTIKLERVASYTILNVSGHTDLTVVYAGLFLLALGVAVSLGVKHRAMRAVVSPTKSGANGSKVSSVTAGAATRGDAAAFDGDFQHLRDALT